MRHTQIYTKEHRAYGYKHNGCTETIGAAARQITGLSYECDVVVWLRVTATEIVRKTNCEDGHVHGMCLYARSRSLVYCRNILDHPRRFEMNPKPTI